MQKLMYIYYQFGNGDIAQGKRILKQIAERLEHARNKHTEQEWQNMNVMQAYNALNEEKHEVCKSICHETEERMQDELKDVIAVAVRMWNKEYGNRN